MAHELGCIKQGSFYLLYWAIQLYVYGCNPNLGCHNSLVFLFPWCGKHMFVHWPNSPRAAQDLFWGLGQPHWRLELQPQTIKFDRLPKKYAATSLPVQQLFLLNYYRLLRDRMSFNPFLPNPQLCAKMA